MRSLPLIAESVRSFFVQEISHAKVKTLSAAKHFSLSVLLVNMSLVTSTVIVPAAVGPKAQLRAGAVAVRPSNVPCIAARSALFGSVRGFQAAGSSRRVASRASRVAQPVVRLQIARWCRKPTAIGKSMCHSCTLY